MSRRVRLRHLPGRLTTGVFIVNSGLSKRHADDGTAAALRSMAAAAYPFLRLTCSSTASATTSPDHGAPDPVTASATMPIDAVCATRYYRDIGCGRCLAVT